MNEENEYEGQGIKALSRKTLTRHWRKFEVVLKSCVR